MKARDPADLLNKAQVVIKPTFKALGVSNRSKRDLPFPITFSSSAYAVPREDLKEGDICHSSQLFYPPPEEVYEKAKFGLTNKGTAALFYLDAPTLLFHFPKTIAAARADAAQVLTQRMHEKALDEDYKGDKEALKFMLNRFDKEDAELAPVISQTFHLQGPIKDITPDDIDSFLTDESAGN